MKGTTEKRRQQWEERVKMENSLFQIPKADAADFSNFRWSMFSPIFSPVSKFVFSFGTPLNSLDLPLWVHRFFFHAPLDVAEWIYHPRTASISENWWRPYSRFANWKRRECNAFRKLKQCIWLFPPLLSRQWSLNSDWLQNGKPSSYTRK